MPRAGYRLLALAVLAVAAASLAHGAPWSGEWEDSPAPASWLLPPYPLPVPLLPEAHANHYDRCSNDGAFGWPGRIQSIRFTSPDGLYLLGDAIFIRVDLSKGVLQAGNQLAKIRHTMLELETGDPDRLAVHAGGSYGSSGAYILYNYTVQPGDYSADLGYVSTRSLYLDGPGSFEQVPDRFGNSYNCRLWAPGEASSLSAQGDIRVVGLRPAALALADTPDGAYGEGREITVAVRFAEAAAYSGDDPPELILNVSGAQRTAAYKSGNGTSTFLFSYVVQPGDGTDDLDYYGTDSLTGAIANGTGAPINRTLYAPGTFGSLSSLSGVRIDPAALPLIAADSARDNVGNFTALGAAADVDIITINGSTYAVVAAPAEPVSNNVRGAVQLVRVHDNGTLEAVYEARDNTGGFDGLGFVYGIDAFWMGGDAYALAASHTENAIQLIRIHGNGTLSPGDVLRNNGTLELAGATRARVFEMGGTMHALVAGFADNGVQLVNITSSGGLVPAGLLRNNGTLELVRAFDAAVFDLGGEKHALVTGNEDDGVQMVRIHGNGTLEAGDSLDDNPDLVLKRSRVPVVFDLGGEKHALVSSEWDHGVQLIRINGDGTLVPLGNATDGKRGFTELKGAFGIAVLGGDASGDVYAAVAARVDHGVQLVRVRASDGALLPAGSAANGTLGFDELYGAHGIASFDIGGGNPYAFVASIEPPGGVQLARLSAASALNVTSAAANGTYGRGDEMDIAVAFDHPVSVSGPAALRLNSGGAAAYRSGNNTAELVFRYEVGTGDYAADLDSAGGGAPFAGGSIRDAALLEQHVGRALPAAGTGRSLGDLRDIAIDGRPPRIAGVTSPDNNGTYGTGTVVNITVRFTEPVAFDSPSTRPEFELDTGNENAAHRHAICTPAEYTSAELACTYTVRVGDAAADLGYTAGSSLELGGAAARAGDGTGLDARLPGSPPQATLSGSKDIALDTAVPEVLRVTSPNASAAYGRGDEIRIEVVFNGTVTIDPAPLDGGASVPALRLETGENDRAAVYAGGSGADTLEFDYTVIAGDFSADLNYTGAGALSLGGGALVDEYGNREGNPALPDPASEHSLGGQKGIEIRTVPTVEGVGANYSGTQLKVGQTVGVRVEFSERVRVVPAANGSLPHMGLDTGRAEEGRAAYSSGSGMRALVFAYPVHPEDSKAVLDYNGTGALKLNGAALRGAGADASPALPEAGSDRSLASAGIELRPNEAPSISPPGSRSHGAGVELRAGITADDPEGQPVTFSLVEPVPAGASIDAASGLLTWTPTEAQRTARGADNSTYVITVRASDPHMASGTARLTVTVVEAPPAGYAGPTIAAIPDAEGREGEAIRLDIAVAAGGHGPFVYSLAVDADPPPPRGAIVHPNGTFYWVPGYDQNGTHQITARAADRFGLDGTGAFSVTVLDAEPPWNLPPAIEAIGPRSVDEGERLVVRVRADDPDLPIAYSLSGDPPARSMIDRATGVFVWDVWYDQAGAHSIDVSAADRYGRASLSSFAVEVADVEPPALPPSIDPIPPQRVEAGTALSLQVNASDPNGGDTVTFGLAGPPPPGAAITAGGLLTWTPGRGQVGQHSLNVTAADDGGLSSWAPLAVTVVEPRAAAAASAGAVFAGPRTVRIDYTAPLGPPAGHAGAVYGSVSIGGGGAAASAAAAAEPASVSGLGTRTHIVRLDGDAAGPAQGGTIRLLADLEGIAGGTLYTFTDDFIPVGAGEDARTLSPPGAPAAPVAAIERGGFVRAVNATAAGDGARPAINVTSLAGGPGAPAEGPRTATMPGGFVSLITSFAVVTFPPNAEASPVPADGLIELYISPRPPTALEVADALGRDGADGIEVLTVAEIGDSGTRIAFTLPVRILLVGQANGSAFYADGAAGGAVVPIRAPCHSDDTAAVHERLGGAGECWLNSGDDKVIYTYHLTRFGTAIVPASTCGATLARQGIDFASIEAGAVTGPVSQEVWRAYDSLPLAEVTIRASNWTRAGAGGDGGGGFAMPASATQIRTGAGGGGGGPWAPLDGAFSAMPGGGGWSAPVEFRLAVPADALGEGKSDVAVSQTVTYTVECAAAAAPPAG